jgi:biopolymer transport protein ExbD
MAITLVAGAAEPAAPWGKSVNGLQTRLMLTKTSVIEGAPIYAILDVRNVSAAPIDMTFCIAMSGLVEIRPLKLNGTLSAPIKPRKQPERAGSSMMLAPGMQTNVWNARLDREFNLAKSGVYRIAWPALKPHYATKGQPPPPSNSIILTINPKAPTLRPVAKVKSDDPIKILQDRLPAGWSTWGSPLPSRTAMHPGRQWSSVPTGYMKVRSALVKTSEGLQRASIPIIVWTAQRQARMIDRPISDDQQDIEQKPTEYLGAGSGYHLYIHLPAEAEKLWPAARTNIIKAFAIKNPTTRPAPTTKPTTKTTTKPVAKPDSNKGVIVMVTQYGPTTNYSVNGAECANIPAVAQALSATPKDTQVIIQIETNVKAQPVASLLAALRKLRMTKISITVAKTSAPSIPRTQP